LPDRAGPVTKINCLDAVGSELVISH